MRGPLPAELKGDLREAQCRGHNNRNRKWKMNSLEKQKKTHRSCFSEVKNRSEI
jgi:hypothetical protein